MKKFAFINVIFFYSLISVNTYSQVTFPYNYCDVKNILSEQQIIKKEKVKSRITWLQDNIEGNYLLTKKKIKQENFSRDGSLAEIIYFNNVEKTDSITIIENNESGMPYKLETFDPLGNILSTVKIQYTNANLVSDIRYIRKSNSPYLITKAGYKDDTIKIWDLDYGTTIKSKGSEP